MESKLNRTEIFFQILETSYRPVLIGLFYSKYGTDGIDEFYRMLNTVNQLSINDKGNSELSVCEKKVLGVIEEIFKDYPNMSDGEILERVFLINKQYMLVDRSLKYPPEITDSNDKDLVKILNNKTNLYFQKNALPKVDYAFTDNSRVITVLTNNKLAISFTEERIKGISYKIGKGISTNFNGTLVGKIKHGFYKIKYNPIIGEDNNKFYELEFISEEKPV